MRRRRAGRPGVMGTMARTAVVAGTASATANAVSRRSAQRAGTNEAPQQQPAPPPPAPAAPQSAPPEDDVIAKLQQLGELKAQGILDDAEFAAAKAKLLA